MSGRRILPAVSAAVAVSAALAVGCSSPPGTPSGSAEVPAASTADAYRGGSASSPFWVDPESDAARQVSAWEEAGRLADAKLLERISTHPVADWPAGDDPEDDIRTAVRGASASRQRVLFVAYNIPHRDCGAYSAGGASDPDAYRSWIERFAAAIGDAPATVVLEPDAVAHVVDGCTPPEKHAERLDLLAAAVDTLKARPETRVYLDAGNPEWLADPGKLVEPLRRAGVGRADGFSLNVANFQTNDTVKAYGARLSALLDGAHYVIDSSRNGRGPLSGGRSEAWCNPPGRALGTPPTTATGDERLDAYLWIKRPGDSDGPCRGGPAAGAWWPGYALGLARAAGS
ncbi:glycoside hydrolase family 6 protein [Streptomyces sp. NBC_00247]|uniref:glycoside hydrolase family 6 protein n=1 Tax=Streptomyces sp. NBC_00247 TaxID=2975689 RepID=UPI002E295A35|nr:glycoside hydrolase family 6 protein [Streptomyces sp. NBC_00247]